MPYVPTPAREGETVTKAPADKLAPVYAAAIRGDATAIALLKGATPTERTAICPPGLAGRARARFINEGMTGAEQRAEAKGKRIAAEADEAKAVAALAQTTSTEEAPVATTTRKPRTRKGAATKPAATTDGMSAASVAKDAGIDARKFRGFLRTKGIARQFTTKASAAKAVKAFQAQS